MQPLSGITVIDLTHMLSGPYCTMLLADLGARTIKVEPPGGETTRTLLASDPKNSIKGMGAYFLTLNRNKESVGIDLKKPEGLRLFRQLVAKADIVVNNFGPGVPKRLGIDWESLSKYNPRIITCSITGFGETGPSPNRPAFDLVAQAMGGGMSITGTAETGPLRAGIPIGDLGGGVFAAVGLLAALNARDRTGKGQHVDISMLDAQISLLNYMATMHFLSGENPPGLGNRHFVHVPYGTFQASDQWIILAVIGDKIWTKCVAALGADDLAAPEFETQPGRWNNQDFICRRVQEILISRRCKDWLEIFAEHGVPCAPVNNLAQAVNDAQIRARNMIISVSHPEGAAVEMPGNPIKLSGYPEQSFRSPPLLGAQTEQVLGEFLGLDEVQLGHLRQNSIIY